MLDRVQVGNYTMYRQVSTELRAWVENPLAKYAGEPVYMLCEITNAIGASKTAYVQEIGTEYSYNVPFSYLKCIHRYAPETGKVMQILGEAPNA